MIEPTEADIGRPVLYTGNRYPGGKIERGQITSFNARAVFVCYSGDMLSKATNRADLEWSLDDGPLRDLEKRDPAV
jgi:hypothetical protein